MIVILLLIISTGISIGFPIKENIKKSIIKSHNLFYQDSINVLIDIDTNGIAYGHKLLWKANTTGTNYEESAVAFVEGIAYIGSCSTHGGGHDKLFAVNTSNGEIIWSFFMGPGYVGPVIDDDVIYIGSCTHGYDPINEYMYAVDRITGDEIWNVPIYGGIAESVQYDEEKIYFCSSFGGETIYALNKDDGITAWTYPTGFYDCANKPMLKDNALYVAVFENYVGDLIKLDTSDGSEIWRISLSGGPWDNSITADGEGRIFLAIYSDRTMNAYSESDGSLLWSYYLDWYPLSFNAYHDGVVFIADTSGRVYALNSVDGSLIWSTKVGSCIDISSPTISGGLIFVGTRDGDDGAFFALDELTGEILWKYLVGASVTAPPSIVEGMMLCGTDGWYMYAFDFGVGGGEWLLHRYDSVNTAYSPYGLLTWQYVEANCSSIDEIVECIVTNTYDHTVNNIILKLDYDAYWYDKQGNLLKSNSDFYTIDSLENSSSVTFLVTQEPFNNNPPSPPSIDGENKGKIGRAYKYEFSSIDHEDDDIKEYIINWDDSSGEETITGPFNSGSSITVSHTWSLQGTYIINAKAIDIFGAESNWSEFTVNMPRYKPTYRSLFYLFLERYPLLNLLQRLTT